jgi:bifunctional DNA primase/polymerase-like protein
MDYTEDALAYARIGFSIIPIKGKKPTALKRWKKYQTSPMSEGEIRRRFRSVRITGLAVILGRVSGDLCCRDFDDADAYDVWASEYPDDAALLPTAKTARGHHVYFRSVGERTRELSDGELRGEGSYCLLPPSVHPQGTVYRWLRSMPDEIPLIDPRDAGLVRLWAAQPDEGQSKQRNGGTQEQSNSGYRGTDVVTGDGPEHEIVSRVSGKETARCSIRSVEEAVEAALPTVPHDNHRSLFTLARALLALEVYLIGEGRLGLDGHLPPECKIEAFELWYAQAQAHLRAEQTKDEYLVEFLAACEDADTPLGCGTLEEIWAAAKKARAPVAAAQKFSDERLILFWTFLRELQRHYGDAPFFLAVRIVNERFGVSVRTAHQWIKAFEGLGVINCVKKGNAQSHRASRFMYLLPLDDGPSKST